LNDNNYCFCCSARVCYNVFSVRQVALQTSRHDNVHDTHWRPVFDSDLNGHMIKVNSRFDGGLTAEQQNQMVDEHNKHRRTEGASDMEKLVRQASDDVGLMLLMRYFICMR